MKIDTDHLDFILILNAIKLIIADFDKKTSKLNKRRFSHTCNDEDQILL